MIRVRNFATGVNEDFPDAGAAGETMGLDRAEIDRAIDEFGRCDSDNQVAWMPSDDAGWEYPTAPAPQDEYDEEYSAKVCLRLVDKTGAQSEPIATN
jgi:hypothetical protein